MRRLLNRFRKAPVHAPAPDIAPVPVVTPEEAVRRVAESSSVDDALAELAVLVHLRWAPHERTDPTWSARLQREYVRRSMPPGVRTALTEWATGRAARWADTCAESEPGSAERHAVWSDPQLIPALFLLESARSHLQIGQSPPQVANDMSLAWRAFDGQGPELAIKSWSRFGRASVDELEGAVADWTQTDGRPLIEWAELAAHPSCQGRLLDRAIRMVAKSVYIEALLDRPDLLETRHAREALWGALERPAVRAALVRATPQGEFGELLRDVAGRDRYTRVGDLLGLATGEQLDGLRITTDELIEWCVHVEPEHRTALMSAAANAVTQDDQPCDG